MSIRNLLVMRITLSNSVARGVGQRMNFWDFLAKSVFVTSSNEVTYLQFSRSEKCPSAVRQNPAKFGTDPKRGSVFPKECSLTGFKKVSF